jgi:hypothetical protein
MTSYHENRSKTGLNLIFEFEKMKTGIPVGFIDLLMDTTGKLVPKPVGA